LLELEGFSFDQTHVDHTCESNFVVDRWPPQWTSAKVDIHNLSRQKMEEDSVTIANLKAQLVREEEKRKAAEASLDALVRRPKFQSIWSLSRNTTMLDLATTQTA